MQNTTMDNLLKIKAADEVVKKLPIKNDTDIEGGYKLAQDDEDIKDSVSNRQQREEFTRKILFMMACELTFIAFLLGGIFIVPYLNALVPKLQINLPPLFFTGSLIIGMMVTYKYLDHIPPIPLKNNKIEIKKIFKFICIIGLLITMNTMERHPYTIYIHPIVMTDTVINIILWASVSVFIKTTILAGLVINGLYDALKSKRNK